MAWASAGWMPDEARTAAEMARRDRVEILVTIDEGAIAERQALEEAGFRVARTEAVVEIPVERARQALADAHLPAGISAVSAAALDVERLRLLDDELRQDVPGTDRWRSTPERFREDTFTDAFDPRTYLVAIDETSGEAIGIVRIWRNRAGPRIGLWAVRSAYRRRGIAAALLAKALGALGSEAPPVVTEYDLTNEPSAGLVTRVHGSETGRLLELRYDGSS